MNEKQCRKAVWDRADGMCERCGSGNAPLTIHHRKKRSHLKKDQHWSSVANLVLLCGSGVSGCHGRVENYPLEAEFLGLHVRPWQDPAKVTVLYRDGTWVLLTADGKLDDRTGMAPPDGFF